MRRRCFIILVTSICQVYGKLPKCCPEGQILDVHSKVCKGSVKAEEVQLKMLTVEASKDGKAWDKVGLEKSLEDSVEKEWDRCSASTSYILTSKFKVINHSQRVLLVDLINNEVHNQATGDFCIDIGHDVRMNPEVDKNKKEESWRKRRPGIYVVIIVKIYWASWNILDKNLSFRLTMRTLAH